MRSRERKNKRAESSPPSEEGLPTYRRLLRFVVAHRGQFALGIVRVNHPLRREGLVASMRDSLSREGMHLFVLDLSQRHIDSLYDELLLQEELRSEVRRGKDATALALLGLEGSIETAPYPGGRLPRFLATLNLQRDNISTRFPVPTTVWLSDYAMDQLADGAPDFFDYYAGLFAFRAAEGERMPQPEVGAPQAPDEGVPAVSAEYLEARIDLLQERQSELTRRKPLEQRDKQRLAELLEQLGEVYSSYRDKGAAVAYFRQAARAFAGLGDRKAQVRVVTRLADSYYGSYRYEEARGRYEEALPIYREIGDRLGEANAIKSLGDVHRMVAEYEEARGRYEEALPIYREIGARLGEANAIRGMAEVAAARNEQTLASRFFLESLTISRDIGDRRGSAIALLRMAVTGCAENVREAVSLLREAAAIFEEIGLADGARRCSEALRVLRQSQVAEEREPYVSENGD